MDYAAATSSESRSATDAASQPQPESPASETVEARAYELFLERGGGDGGDVEDWLRAEQELSRRRNGQRGS
jgi:hypothetical protein